MWLTWWWKCWSRQSSVTRKFSNKIVFDNCYQVLFKRIEWTERADRVTTKYWRRSCAVGLSSSYHLQFALVLSLIIVRSSACCRHYVIVVISSLPCQRARTIVRTPQSEEFLLSLKKDLVWSCLRVFTILQVCKECLLAVQSHVTSECSSQHDLWKLYVQKCVAQTLSTKHALKIWPARECWRNVFLRLSCLPESCGITVLQKYVGDSVLEWFGGRVLYENEGARAVISCDLKGDVPEYSTQSSHRSLLLTCSQRVFVRNNFRHCQVAFYWQKSLYCKVQESATWVLYSVVVLKLI